MACIIEVKHYAAAKWQDGRYVSYITLNKIRVARSHTHTHTRHTYKTWILGGRYQISREQGILDFLVKSDQYRSYFLIYGDSLTVKHNNQHVYEEQNGTRLFQQTVLSIHVGDLEREYLVLVRKFCFSTFGKHRIPLAEYTQACELALAHAYVSTFRRTNIEIQRENTDKPLLFYLLKFRGSSVMIEILERPAH